MTIKWYTGLILLYLPSVIVITQGLDNLVAAINLIAQQYN